MATKRPLEKKSVVVGYVRVSTENQLENYSIEEQTARIEAYCAAKDWILLKTYPDGAHSGGNTARPGLQQMLQVIREVEVDAVVVYKLDRLSRSQKDTLMLIEDVFLANGIDFVSINENFDTSSPFGRAMIGILSVFAQLEKDQITERFTMGRIGRGKAGFYHGGPTPPTGYTYENGELLIDEYGALAVQEIYQSFLGGKSINAIWHDMQARYDKFKWSAAKVRNILMNSTYIGKVKFAGEEYAGRHEPIISKPEFDTVQHLLSSFERESGKNSAQKTPFRAGYLLSSLVVCGRCGARYSANHGYYKCYSRAKSSKRFIIDPSCKNENWEIAKLDNMVVSAVRDLLSSPELLNELLADARHKHHPRDTAKIAQRIAEINKQIERMVELYQVGGIPMDTITKSVHKLDAEKRVLAAELEEEEKHPISQADFFLRASDDFLRYFPDAPLENKRQIIGSMIETVLIDGNSFKIKWRL